MSDKPRCKHCGHKLKVCSKCGVVQTLENSRITRGRFESTCNKCTAAIVLRIKYDKMTPEQLKTLRDKHQQELNNILSYIKEAKPCEK